MKIVPRFSAQPDLPFGIAVSVRVIRTTRGYNGILDSSRVVVCRAVEGEEARQAPNKQTGLNIKNFFFFLLQRRLCPDRDRLQFEIDSLLTVDLGASYHVKKA